jgi:hypothetical protein
MKPLSWHMLALTEAERLMNNLIGRIIYHFMVVYDLA